MLDGGRHRKFLFLPSSTSNLLEKKINCQGGRNEVSLERPCGCGSWEVNYPPGSHHSRLFSLPGLGRWWAVSPFWAFRSVLDSRSAFEDVQIEFRPRRSLSDSCIQKKSDRKKWWWFQFQLEETGYASELTELFFFHFYFPFLFDGGSFIYNQHL